MKIDQKQPKAGQDSYEIKSFISNLVGGLTFRDIQLLQPYRENQQDVLQERVSKSLSLILQLLDVHSQNASEQFRLQFTFGFRLQFWRKGKVKPIMVYIDQKFPNFVWFSSQTKAYLFDMAYTQICHYDYQIEKESNSKHVILLSYFQQIIPLLFRNQMQKQYETYYRIFNNYIKFCKLKRYPAYISKITKLFRVEQTQTPVLKNKSFKDILKFAQRLSIRTVQKNKITLANIFFNSYKLFPIEDSEFSNQHISSFFQISHCNKNLLPIFEKYCKKKVNSQLGYLQPLMNSQQFIMFLIEEQKCLKQVAVQLAKQLHETINFYDFCSFLYNQKFNYAAVTPDFDDDHPLTDYFCYSSHNTYLSGNQLTSDSKVERYLEDLELGLKCVEIDIHNDGDIPIITHAHRDMSLCKSINFEQTIKEMADYLKNNQGHYPIIISVQNHAKEENRFKIHNIFLKQFEKKIFMVSEEYRVQHPFKCKTLRELKGKVIIKTDSRLNQVTMFLKKIGKTEDVFEHKMLVDNFQFEKHHSKFPNPEFQKKYDQFQVTINQIQKKKKEFNVNILSSHLLPISQMAKITAIFKVENGVQNINSIGYQCTSLKNSDKQFSKKDNYQKITNYTKRSFLRIYPKATEVSSGNFDPVPHLQIGAQIIALNTQTKDDHAWMMMSYFKAGKFGDSRNHGYVLKPEHLRTGKSKNKVKTTIIIKQLLFDQSLTIKFHGTERDIKANNNKLLSSAFQISDLDEGFLIFKIGEKLKECLPTRFLRHGYRVIVGKDADYRDSGKRIIIHIDIIKRN